MIFTTTDNTNPRENISMTFDVLLSTSAADFTSTSPPPINASEFNNTSVSAFLPSTERSLSQLQLFSYMMNVYVNGLLCVLGFCGNILAIAVLQRDKRRNSNSVLLQALAAADLVFLAYVVLYVVLRSVYPYTGALRAYHDLEPYVVALVLPVGWTSQTLAVWFLVVVAVDRYVVVSHPLRGIRWCTVGNAWRAVAVMTVIGVVFNVPRWMHYYYVAFHTQGGGTNATFVSHLSVDVSLWDERVYRGVYHVSLTLVCLFILPLLALVCLNTKLILLINESARRRRHLTNSVYNAKITTRAGGAGGGGGRGGGGKANTSVTLNLVVVISIFLVCETPDMIATIIAAGEFNLDKTVLEYYLIVKETLLVFNSAVNFYVYVIFYRRFREVLARLCGCGSEERSGLALTTVPHAGHSQDMETKITPFSSLQNINKRPEEDRDRTDRGVCNTIS